MIVSIFCKYTQAAVLISVYQEKKIVRNQTLIKRKISTTTLIARVHFLSSESYILQVEINFLFQSHSVNNGCKHLFQLWQAFSNAEAKIVRCVDNFFIGCLDNLKI